MPLVHWSLWSASCLHHTSVYYCFVVSFEVGTYESSNFVFVFDIVGLFRAACNSIWIRCSAFTYAVKVIGILITDFCTKSVDHFGEYCHSNNIKWTSDYFSFINVFNFFWQCSMYKFFTFLFSFIPRYFILLDAIINGTTFLTSFSGCSLLVYRNKIGNCVLILYLANFVEFAYKFYLFILWIRWDFSICINHVICR